MTSIRPFRADDVFKFNSCNLDPLTETYGLDFYFSYLAKWPELFWVAEGADGTIQGYSMPSSRPPTPLPVRNTDCRVVMGKLESSPQYMASSPHYLPYHAHITALTVAPSARRLGLARILSQTLEDAGNRNNAYFVDLFVRKSNTIAISLYKGLGYSVYRVVKDYYSDNATPGAKKGEGEDAFDMRKPLERDVKLEHHRDNGEEFEVSPEDVW